MMKGKKKQILFLVCLFFIIIGSVIVILKRNDTGSPSTDFQESDREDTVIYDGRTYRYNDHLSNYLFMGIDVREQAEDKQTRTENGRADAIYLLSYDRVEKTMVCLSIPRDTMTDIHAYSVDGTDLGLTEDHINMQYVYGDGKEKSCLLMKEVVSNLMYGVPIQGYCALNMDGIPAAVQTIGSVEVVVPNASLEAVEPTYKKGQKVLITEENAELFVRYRDTNISQSAMDRTERQKAFMEAFLETVKSRATDNTKVAVEMHDSLKPYMISNIGTDVLAQLLSATSDSDNGIMDIPGDKVTGSKFDEYRIRETELYEQVLRIFYNEVQGDES